ncbi:MAG TPA: MBL fold metallo-hydrolase [Thermoanaerobaculia bacterium]|nr:MBL fold metallo-hydrolase [Thermoanaerobaculia bacterium]
MAAKKKSSADKIRVRMYRVGMGDCFLVSIGTGKSRKHILIDCGVHAQSKFKGLKEAVAAIEKETGGELDVVVATHAHADHISGFGTEADTFNGFKRIGEVWLPWLEDLSNPAAKKLHAKTTALASLLDAHMSRLGAEEKDPLIEWVTLNALGAKGRSSTGNNAKALALLRGGFGDKSRTRYLKAGDVLSDAGGIKGLTVRVLAPSTDTKFLSKMQPPESQLYGLDENGQVVTDSLSPFGDHWNESAAALDEDYQKELVRQCAVPLQALALSVDNYLNNTSLSLLLQYRGKTLLFPGDAQWGNWMSWQSDWESILGDISFYKVGHHGSHNATPHGALELMSAKGVTAMASTDTVDSFNRGHFPVPYPKLVTSVKKQVGNRYVQSDELGKAKAPFKAVNKQTEQWCDYEV